MIWAILLLLVACGGSGETESNRPEPGWCCDGLCGLSAEDTESFAECTCEAAERRTDAPGRGECLAVP